MGPPLPKYLRSIKANPEHALAVYQFLDAASQFDKASQRLARVAGENDEINSYFFGGIADRSSNLQCKGDLSHSHQDSHMPESDHIPDILYIDPDLLHKLPNLGTEISLTKALLTGLGLASGDLEQNLSNKSLSSTDAILD